MTFFPLRVRALRLVFWPVVRSVSTTTGKQRSMPRTSHGQTRAVAAAAVAGDVLQALDGQDVEAALRCKCVSKRDKPAQQGACRAHQVALDLVLRHLVTQHSQLLLGQLARALVLDFLAAPGRELREGATTQPPRRAPSPPGWPSPWWARCRRCTCGGRVSRCEPCAAPQTRAHVSAVSNRFWLGISTPATRAARMVNLPRPTARTEPAARSVWRRTAGDIQG